MRKRLECPSEIAAKLNGRTHMFVVLSQATASIDHIYLERVKTLEACYGSTAWHTECALRLAQVMADRTAHRASG